MWRLRQCASCPLGFAALVASATKSHTTACDIDTATPNILGLGYAGIDYIAMVGKYPEADEKIRTTSLSVHGGGNCGNTLTAMSRLGHKTSILSKVGLDAHGGMISEGLKAEGINTSNLVQKPNITTGFVYVIVDKAASTRTCIATPVEEELSEEEVSRMINDGVLDNVNIVHLDSRHTAAAVSLAFEANKRSIVVCLDAEKDRPPHFRSLLPMVDILFTNETFSQVYFGRINRDVTLQSTLFNGPESVQDTNLLHRVIGMAKFITETSIEELQKTGMKPEAQAISGGGRGIQMVVSTMGAQGAVLVRRRCPRPRSAVLLTSVSPTLSAVESDTSSLPPTAVFPSAVNDILASVDLDLLQRAPLMLQTFELHISNGRHHPSDSKPYVQESEKSSRQSSASPAQSPADAAEVFEVIRCSAWPVREIVDTTGAGDAFIGGFISGMVSGFSAEDCLRLGSVVAALKLGKPGAREGLPTVESINRTLS